MHDVSADSKCYRLLKIENLFFDAGSEMTCSTIEQIWS
jgi:hypothetical protein